MNSAKDPRFFALLVHQGLLHAETARQALFAPDPVQYLIDAGHITAEKWDDWVSTEAGMRPKLSRYELGELLGEGGTARVFLATDRKMGDVCALKILKPALCKDPTTVEKFIRESKLLMELQNEHIVAGKRVAREGEVFYCEMEVIEGRCLQDDLDEEHPMDEIEALRITVQVAKALEYLHGRGLVHRDIKPGNIMLADDGRAVLIDLGFAAHGSEEARTSDSTSGTVHYISPEQARGHADLDVRADIYSLGATLYHLVTGSLPFAGADSQEIMAKQVLESLSGDRIRALGLSPQTHFFIEKMMAKEKEIRFQDPAELIRDIEAYLKSVAWEEKMAEEAEAKTKAKTKARTKAKTRSRSSRRSSRRRRS